jgi:hypothetical protein
VQLAVRDRVAVDVSDCRGPALGAGDEGDEAVPGERCGGGEPFAGHVRPDERGGDLREQRRLASRAAAGVRAGGRARIGDRAGARRSARKGGPQPEHASLAGQMPACSGLSDTSPEEWRERQNQGRRGEDCGGDCVGLPEAEPVGRQASDR